MAKEKIDLYDDFEEISLDDFDMDIDFGTKPPPKNKREAIFQSVGDAAESAYAEVKPNRENIKKFLENSVPKQLYSEFSSITDGIDEIKNTASTSLKELRKSAKEANDVLKKLLPKGGKIEGMLNKIGEKLSNDMASSVSNMEDRLAAGLQAELQNQFTKENTLQLINTEKQLEKTNDLIALTKMLVKDTTVLKNFQIEVTNDYYRKSLELQYKQLFAIREQTESQKAYFETFKNQISEVVRNTALPEIVKMQNKEVYEQVVKQKAMEKFNRFIFEDVTPVKKIITNVKRGLKNQFDDFILGIQMGAEMGGAAADMKEATEGMVSKSSMAGTMLGEQARNMVAKYIGTKLAESESGKKAVFNIKNAVADPTFAIDMASKKLLQQADIEEDKALSKGKLGNFKSKSLRWLGDRVGDISSMGRAGNYYRGEIYNKRELDTPTVFDNKTKISIVETIPGYLAKIYGELRATREGYGTGEDFEVHYDHVRRDFLTKDTIISNLKKDIKTKLKEHTEYSLKTIADFYIRYGKITEDEANILCSSLFTYATIPSPREAPAVLVTDEFLRFVPEDLREKFRKAGQAVLSEAIENYNILNTITSVLHNLISRIPNPSQEIDDLFSMGRGKWVQDMGWSEYNSSYQTHNVKSDAVIGFLREQYDQTKNVKKAEKAKPKMTLKEVRAMYFASVERKNGDVINFTEWVKESGIQDQVEIVDEKGDVVNNVLDEKVNEKVKKSKLKLMSKIQKTIYEKITGQAPKDPEEELKESRAEYFASEERKKGDVNSFQEWMAESGKIDMSNIFYKLQSDLQTKGIFKVTRALDRKIAKGLFKGAWKATKWAGKATKWAATKALPFGIRNGAWLGKELTMALPTNLWYLYKGEEYAKGKENAARMGLDRKMVRDVPKGAEAGIKLSGKIGKMMYKGVKTSGRFLSDLAKKTGMGWSDRMTALGLDSIREAVEANNPDNKKKNIFDTDGDGERQGGWRSRLKGLFSNKDKKDREASKGIMGWMKDHKGLSTSMILMGILGILKAIGISATDVVKGITSVANGIKWGFDKISGLISGVTKFITSPIDTAKGWFNKLIGNEDAEKTKEQIEEESKIETGAKVVAGLGMAGAGAYAVRHPINAIKGAGKGIWKTTSFGYDCVKWLVNLVRGVPGSDKVIENADEIAKKIDKTVGTADKMMDNLKKLKKRLTNPRVIKLVGKKTIAKVGAKLMSLGAGPLAILGILIGVWDAIWVAKYMMIDGLSFMDALCKQLLGHTWNDIEETAEYTEEDEEAARDKFLKALEDGDTKKVKRDAEMDVIKNQPLDLMSVREYNNLVEKRYVQLQAERDAASRKAGDEYNHIKETRAANNPMYKADKMGDNNRNDVEKQITNSSNTNVSNKPINNANYSNMKYGQPTLDPKVTGAAIVKSAAAIMTSRAHVKTTGKCGRYVREGLNAAGINLPVLPSAYMQASPNGLPSVGFERLKVDDPNNYPKQVGDVYVIDKFVGNKGKNHPHGHIAMWNGKQWVSDFKQRNMNIYSDLPNDQFKKITSVWRLTDKEAGAMESPNGDIPTSTSTIPRNTSANNSNDALSSINLDMATENSRSTTSYNTTRAAPNVNNQVLNTISNTLSKSLEVQLRMADTLESIKTMSNATSKPINQEPSKKPNTNNYEKAPTYPINMKRNTYA